MTSKQHLVYKVEDRQHNKDFLHVSKESHSEAKEGIYISLT